MRILASCVCALAFILVIVQSSCIQPRDAATVSRLSRRDLESMVELMARARLDCLLSGDASRLRDIYDVVALTGAWAYEHEVGRVRYFREWLARRSTEVVSVDSSVSLVDGESGADTAWASFCHNVMISYRRSRRDSVSIMGIRTVHWMELARKGGRWLIRRDWFWDPLGSSQRPRVPAEVEPEPGRQGGRGSAVAAAGGSYNRAAAIAYADRYCGVKTAANDGRYNPKYRDFANLGGDCASFASQVLADRDAGGLPMDDAWFYDRGEGTQAWTRAAAFVEHFLYSGRATLLRRGRYASVAPLVSRLQPGDVIAFEDLGEVKHVSVVTGLDADGRVVVNSHTADRYRVPWDLGFEEDDVFWLIHIEG